MSYLPISFRSGGEFSFNVSVKPDFFEVQKNSEGLKIIKEGWSDRLRGVITKKLHLPCAMAFRRIKHRSKDISVTNGYCRQKECLLKISATLPHQSNQLTVTLENYDAEVVHKTIIHDRIPPEQKTVILKNLQGKSAYAVRNELADEILTDASCNPGRVPTSNTLRIMKYRNQALGNEENAVLILNDLRETHTNCIQKIELFPFAIHYATPSQKSWYKNEFSGKKRSTISIDATGVNVVSPTDLKKHIFLYVVCAHGKSFI